MGPPGGRSGTATATSDPENKCPKCGVVALGNVCIFCYTCIEHSLPAKDCPTHRPPHTRVHG